MALTTGTAILITVVFVLPGFVTLTLRERADVVNVSQTPFEQLLGALLYSAVIYALVVGIGLPFGLDRATILDVWHGRAPLTTILSAGVVIILVAPAVLAETGVLWRRSSRLRPRTLKLLGISAGHGVRSAWNQAFRTSPDDALLRVVCTDGKVIAGQWGGGALSGYSEHHQDLFLQPHWSLSDDDDQWFLSAIPSSHGIWIAASTIARVEFYRPHSDPDSTTDVLTGASRALQGLATLAVVLWVICKAAVSSSPER